MDSYVETSVWLIPKSCTFFLGRGPNISNACNQVTLGNELAKEDSGILAIAGSKCNNNLRKRRSKKKATCLSNLSIRRSGRFHSLSLSLSLSLRASLPHWTRRDSRLLPG